MPALRGSVLLLIRSLLQGCTVGSNYQWYLLLCGQDYPNQRQRGGQAPYLSPPPLNLSVFPLNLLPPLNLVPPQQRVFYLFSPCLAVCLLQLSAFTFKEMGR